MACRYCVLHNGAHHLQRALRCPPVEGTMKPRQRAVYRYITLKCSCQVHGLVMLNAFCHGVEDQEHTDVLLVPSVFGDP